VAGGFARLERRLVLPQRDHERGLPARVGEPDETAEPGALRRPRQQVVAHDRESPLELLRCRLEGVDAHEHRLESMPPGPIVDRARIVASLTRVAGRGAAWLAR